MSSTESSTNSYPMGSRVILQNLTKGTEFNGKVGVVKSKLGEGGERQQVLLLQSGKTLGIKPMNLKYEPRSVKSLSIAELKAVLAAKDVSASQMTGYDKNQLREMVKIKTDDSGEELARTLYAVLEKESESGVARGGAGNNSNHHASMLGNMSPEQLRQQAQMMRSMPPSQIRRTNPAMANFSDAQIQMAASQMDTMANNPQMMKGMVEQMKNMSPSEIERIQKMQQGQTPTPTAGGGPGMRATPTSQNIADMSPEQLRQQATMMKSMTPDALRSMNPAMANWPDAQIQMAITQMETMAENPDMMKRMSDQMKGMKPEEIEKIRKMAERGEMDAGDMTDATGAPAQNPMDMLNSADPAQIKQMLSMVKENPQLMKDILRSGGMGGLGQMSDEQIEKTVNAFAGMDEQKIGWLIKVMGWVQNFKNSSKMKMAMFLVMGMFVFVVGMLVYLVKKSKELDATGTSTSTIADLTNSQIPQVPMMEEESEF